MTKNAIAITSNLLRCESVNIGFIQANVLVFSIKYIQSRHDLYLIYSAGGPSVVASVVVSVLSVVSSVAASVVVPYDSSTYGLSAPPATSFAGAAPS